MFRPWPKYHKNLKGLRKEEPGAETQDHLDEQWLSEAARKAARFSTQSCSHETGY
jgi:hypothetical protein